MLLVTMEVILVAGWMLTAKVDTADVPCFEVDWRLRLVVGLPLA